MKQRQADNSSRWLLLGVLAVALLALPAQASAQPSIQSQWVSDVTESGAVLNAEFDPAEFDQQRDEEGYPDEGAVYQFQIAEDPSALWPEVTCPDYQGEVDVPCYGPYGIPGASAPVASIERRPGDLPTEGVIGYDPLTASVDLGEVGRELQPGTTYYFRLIAARTFQSVDAFVWYSPPVYGPTQSFTTPSAGGEAGSPPAASSVVPAGEGVPQALPGPGSQPPRKSRRCQRRSEKQKLRKHARRNLSCRRSLRF